VPYTALTIASTLAWGLGYFGMPHILLRFMGIENDEKLKLSRRVASVWVVISMAAAVCIGIVGLGMSHAGAIGNLEGSASETIVVVISELLSKNGVLAALLAPKREVEAKSILSREIYNATLTEELGADTTFFQDGFLYRSGDKLHVLSTAGANPDLPRLYVLVTGASASASESLICCLKPYMDVVVLGSRTSGKYCAGVLMSAETWFDEVKDALEEGEYEASKPYVENWGIYVMYARYADCNGVTLSMPDGIAPDCEVEDNPLDGYPLGDAHETMLAAALELIEGRTRASGTAPAPSLVPVSGNAHPRGTGLFLHH